MKVNCTTKIATKSTDNFRSTDVQLLLHERDNVSNTSIKESSKIISIQVNKKIFAGNTISEKFNCILAIIFIKTDKASRYAQYN